MRVFVNAGSLELPAGADVQAAIRAFDPELARKVASGAAYVTDGRGIKVSSGSPLAAGAILRIISKSRRGPDVQADA